MHCWKKIIWTTFFLYIFIIIIIIIYFAASDSRLSNSCI